jgi:biopolymer transport protein ExbD
MTRQWKPRPIVVAQPAPMINTTPLIDVMLVLLVMLILAIPLATHRLPVDVPPPDPDVSPTLPPTHRLDIDAGGRFSWDGRAVSEPQLVARLAAMAREPAEPVLYFAPEAETRYERVDETLALVMRAGVTRLGFVGNDRFNRMLDEGR